MVARTRKWLWVASLGSIALALPARADLALHAFADVNAHLNHSSDHTHLDFDSNRFDLFASGSHDRVTLLSEVVFEVGGNNEFAPDVERLQISYNFGDYLRVSAGRFHTSIGYYNDAFHHGAVFQLPTERPRTVRFEDDGGLIPAHFVGFHADGRVPVGTDVRLRYDVEVANSRGPTRDVVVNAFDRLDAKAFNGRLRLEAPVGEGTAFVGVNAVFDKIADIAGRPELSERMFGVHAVYQGPLLSLIAEGYLIRHGDPSGNDFDTRAGFVEVGIRLPEDVTPYAILERIDLPAGGDPYFTGEGSQTLGTAGVRWLFAEATAVKLEASRSMDTGVGTLFTAQFAFGF
ncbi:MAG TPA: hypothetical protein VGH20_05905 [Myxococcales bacterium]|jgi:hypothetical protein